MNVRRLAAWVLPLALGAVIVGCGGSSAGGDDASFSGYWQGTLRGTSCVDNAAIERNVIYYVRSASAEEGEVVELTDGLDNYYSGNVTVDRENGLGFLVELSDQTADGEFPSFIRFSSIGPQRAAAEAIYNISVISPYGCNYSLTATVSKMP